VLEGHARDRAGAQEGQEMSDKLAMEMINDR
jgi:hypothetical protein